MPPGKADDPARYPAIFSLRAASLARAHTVLSLAAFASALALGCTLHFRKIVKNGVAGWPQEWFPSVSATIGDWYPERNIFQILIALNSGPRFIVLLLTYLHTHSKFPSSSLPSLLLVTGVVRTLSCGGWVYITSSDDHDAHDVLMIIYIVCNIPWMWANARLAVGRARRRRIWIASSFWLSLIPMVYFFIQHKVHHVPGAYTRYSLFEWSLILFDVLYDATAELEFRDSGLKISIGAAPTDFNGDGGTYDETHASASKNTQDGLAPSALVSEKVESVDATAPEVAGTPEASRALGTFLSAQRPAFSFLADVYFSYQTWTVLTALPVTLFYFSVWKLALAGPEFSTLATLAPVFLASRRVREACRTRLGRAVLATIVAGAGIGSWGAESVWARLGGVVMGTAAGVIRWAGEWEETAVEGGGHHGIVFLLGLLVSALSKHLNNGNNPGWPIVDEKSGGHHKSILILSALALVEFMTRPASSPYPPALSLPSSLSSTEQTPSKHTARPNADAYANAKAGPWLPSALALGALLYALHERLTDPSTLVAWSWTGYPLSGPHPHAHAPLTLVAQALGVALALSASSPRLASFLAHPAWCMFGMASAGVLYACKDWAGYLGALAHAVFLVSIAPQVLRAAGAAARGAGGTGRRTARVFVAAWATWVVLLFSGTFTVAYAFVPGAWSFRERTDLVLASQLILLTPAFHWPSLTRPLTPSLPALQRATHTRTYTLLALVALLGLLAPLTAHAPSPPPAPAPAHARARLLNAGIWTVHFGIDDAGRDSQRRMRDLVRDMQLDVVGLLETDLHYVDIGPGPNQHTWGAVLMSKFPILKSTHHLLPSPDGELAPAIEAILDIYGTNVTVLVAHNGQEETPLDRELQATELARIMAASYPDPLIYLGYVVTKPKALRPAPYDIMVTDGKVHDIDHEDWDRWCEYIFYRGLYRTAYARVSRSTITDTELQIGQFVVPRYGHAVVNDTEEDRYLRAWKEQLPEEHWFPMEYYSPGRRGHFYHVFNTPLYYGFPDNVVL
ncbi:hypothetical protein HETIRDRAFT_458538 [Heterobasidion irregulare TC 32-1]|uniref:Calcofluor white hypersensitive protein n=1 Tax=Heterobasidion irregulare (strain TC 32-1) TaxID=747525 RepID=W4KCX4_HETIT|nr:uncharacterized protein HETIRDRAFT_458538 [Heterobasidion irregulare TC 32-1]ETW82916.1 hypothetical protein HETIRDRAFT_458538 [Heterobasidion irregulare TC 32-1]